MAATLFWFSGAETGSIKEFPGSPGGGASVVSSPVRTGSYSLLTPIQSGVPAAKVKIVYSSNATTYLRAYFKTSSNPALSQAILGFGTNGSQARLHVWLNADGTVGWSHGPFPGSPTASGSDAISLSNWNLLEVKFVRDASVGGMEVYLNGALQTSDFTVSTTTGTSATATVLQFGDVDDSDHGSGQDLYWDDIAFGAGGYIGAGQSLAFQGQSGTPTYDAWIKTVATTADEAWSETPYSATKNCIGLVSGDKQTMLLASLGAVPPAATINGMFLGAIARSTSISSTVKLLRRVSGSDTLSAAGLVLSNTDKWIPNGLNNDDMGVFVDTLSNLATAEIGAEAEDSINNTTIEDMWLLVDYAPPPPLLLEMHVPIESLGAPPTPLVLEFFVPVESLGVEPNALIVLFDVISVVNAPLFVRFTVQGSGEEMGALMVQFDVLPESDTPLLIRFSVIPEGLVTRRKTSTVQAPIARVDFT